MALAFRSRDHAKQTNTPRPAQLEVLQVKFPGAKAGAHVPTIPDPKLFAGLAAAKRQDATEAGPALPTVAECAVHLELLEAIVVLQQKVTSSNAVDRALGIVPRDTVRRVRGRPQRSTDPTFPKRRQAKWPVFLRLAALRFLAWRAAAQGVFQKHEALNIQPTISEELLPPLDVLMIWHAFLLDGGNHKSSYEASSTEEWLDVQFPWALIHAALRDGARSFHAPPRAEVFFAQHVGSYDLFAAVANQTRHSASLKEALASIALTAGSDTPATYMAASLCPLLVHTFSAATFDRVRTGWAEAGTLAAMATRRQTTSFAEEMAGRLWLRSPAAAGTLRRAGMRYERFLSLLFDGEGGGGGGGGPAAAAAALPVIPTRDIALVWYTYRCSPAVYVAEHRRRTGRELTAPAADDNSDEEETPKQQAAALRDGLVETARRYEARFYDEYNACLCWECEALRDELGVGEAAREENKDRRQVVEGKGGRDGNVNFAELVARAQLLVEFHQAVEAARRGGMPLPAVPEKLKGRY